MAAAPAFAETRSYAVTWFAQASYSQDGDCGAGGINPKMADQTAKDLRDLGFSGGQVEQLLKQSEGAEERGWDLKSARGLMNQRARVNGQPANAYAHPAAVKDPNLKIVSGKYAYGFNLDGKGANDASAFEDPQSHEKGVDNQLFRALGCIDAYRGTLENDTAFWSFMWMAEKDAAPAWLINITGEDLSKDGPVTISFTRSMETPRYNGDGSPRADMTYREDPDPRMKGNTYKGQIKDNVVTITENGGALHMMQDQLTFPNFDMKNFHVRLAIAADGAMSGIIGGYQPIEQVYFCLAEGGQAHEGNVSPEIPGIYWNLRKLADADPDPKTGQNWSISGTYHIKAVPAFVVPAKAETHTAARH